MLQDYKDSTSYRKIISTNISRTEFRSIKNYRKVAIFSAFVKSEEEFNYHDKIYKWLHGNGYAVILVMPKYETLSINKYSCSRACDILITRENFGYDFGSYAAGLADVEDIDSLDNLIFVNDSAIGPFGPADSIVDTADFWANTDSNQIKYHYQSYLFGFRITNISSLAIKEFFFGRGDIYTNDKCKVINNFELAMYDFFLSKGLSCQVNHKLSNLKSIFKRNISNLLRPPNTLHKVMFYTTVRWREVNPTHQLWFELFTSGYPFIKKELVRDNPTNYPCLNEKIDIKMREVGCFNEYKKIFKKHV